MRKLYKEFFYIPKHGKVCEKVMLTRVAMTIVIMVLCLVAMSITAYAYFSSNVTSDSNIIKSASFNANVTIKVTDENGVPIDVTVSNGFCYQAKLNADTPYYITISRTEESTGSGFALLTVKGCKEQYHTRQLGKVGDDFVESIKFWVKPDLDTTITLLAQWGTSSYYADYLENGDVNELYITDGETIEPSITPVALTPETADTQTTSSTDSNTEFTVSDTKSTEAPPVTESTD